MFDERELRTFLLKVPKPSKVIVHTEDGPQELSSSSKNWRSIAQSIVAMKGEAVELYDVDGKLLRATRSDEREPGGVGIPVAPLPLATDPETVRLLHFANLLYRATEFSTTLAFEKMVDLFERVADRSNAIEERLERTEAAYRRSLNEQLREALLEAQQEQQAGAPNTLGALIEAFSQGNGLARAQAPNGKEAHP